MTQTQAFNFFDSDSGVPNAVLWFFRLIPTPTTIRHPKYLYKNYSHFLLFKQEGRCKKQDCWMRTLCYIDIYATNRMKRCNIFDSSSDSQPRIRTSLFFNPDSRHLYSSFFISNSQWFFNFWVRITAWNSLKLKLRTHRI